MAVLGLVAGAGLLAFGGWRFVPGWICVALGSFLWIVGAITDYRESR